MKVAPHTPGEPGLGTILKMGLKEAGIQVGLSGTVGNIQYSASTGGSSAGVVVGTPVVGGSVDGTIFAPSDGEKVLAQPYVGVSKHMSVGTNVVENTSTGEVYAKGVNVSVGLSTPDPLIGGVVVPIQPTNMPEPQPTPFDIPSGGLVVFDEPAAFGYEP